MMLIEQKKGKMEQKRGGKSGLKNPRPQPPHLLALPLSASLSLSLALSRVTGRCLASPPTVTCRRQEKEPSDLVHALPATQTPPILLPYVTQPRQIRNPRVSHPQFRHPRVGIRSPTPDSASSITLRVGFDPKRPQTRPKRHQTQG